jgi:hypothetical protein
MYPRRFLRAPLPGKHLVRVGCGGLGSYADLSGTADASPFAD